MSSRLLELLEQENLLSFKQNQAFRNTMKNKSVKAIQALADSNDIATDTIANFLSDYLSIERVSLQSHDLSLNNKKDHELMSKHSSIPIEETSQQITLAVADPTDPDIEQDFAFATGKRIKIVIADWKELSDKLKHLQTHHIIAEQALNSYSPTADFEDEKDSSEDDWENNNTPVTQYLYQILFFAYQHQASDIHFEPFEHQYQIRLRIDGLLSTQFEPDKTMSKRLTARIKVLANLNIAERRHPQDGRFKVRISEHIVIDLRVSTIPTLWGEKIVLRLLNSNFNTLDSRKLGMNQDQISLWLNSLQQPQGLILVTGPTGSGKTFTLYSGLSELDTESKNITTIEDPIEIQLHGINQVQINPQIQLTFSEVLKAILRQDPDVIMVGEIRDQETAEMAFRAAQTGHLVLSTLHTNSALESISRLQQIGIPNYLIAGCTNLIIAQRLVRRLCPHCKRSAPLPEELQSQPQCMSVNSVYQENPDGCSQCHKGYKGRLGIFELLPFTTENKDLLFTSSAVTEQKEVQFQTLWQSGLSLLNAGETSFTELLRVIKHESIN